MEQCDKMGENCKHSKSKGNVAFESGFSRVKHFAEIMDMLRKYKIKILAARIRFCFSTYLTSTFKLFIWYSYFQRILHNFQSILEKLIALEGFIVPEL